MRQRKALVLMEVFTDKRFLMLDDPASGGSFGIYRNARGHSRGRQAGFLCVNLNIAPSLLQKIDRQPVVGHEFLNLSAQGLTDLSEVHDQITAGFNQGIISIEAALEYKASLPCTEPGKISLGKKIARRGSVRPGEAPTPIKRAGRLFIPGVTGEERSAALDWFAGSIGSRFPDNPVRFRCMLFVFE
jgi:hypothetical protein